MQLRLNFYPQSRLRWLLRRMIKKITLITQMATPMKNGQVARTSYVVLDSSQPASFDPTVQVTDGGKTEPEISPPYSRGCPAGG